MDRSRLRAAVTLAALVLISTATVAVRSQEARHAYVPPALVPHRESEGNFVEQYERAYVRPRAFPLRAVRPGARLAAFRRLQNARRELKRPHIGAQFRTFRHGCFACDPIPPGTIGWRSVGPTNINGRVTSIAIDPKNGARIFVATVGGIWRSTDTGRNWEFVTDAVPSQIYSAVAIRPDGKEVIAGTGDPNYPDLRGDPTGIYVSPAGDPGTWQKSTPAALEGVIVQAIAYDTAAPYDVYAATRAGVWKGARASDGTLSWSQLGGFDAETTGLAVDTSATPLKVYAGVRNASQSYARGIWKWDGTSWARKDSGIPWAVNDTEVVTLAIAPSAPATLYAKISQKSDGNLLGIYKTTTGGEAPQFDVGWHDLPGGSVVTSGDSSFYYSWYNAAIAVDPTDAKTVYAGGVDLYRSTDGGASFTDISAGGDTSYPLGLHSDHHAVAFDPANPKIVYDGDDGGISRGSDYTQPAWRWNDIKHGLIVTQFYQLAATRTFGTLLLGAAQDNGIETTFGNRTWYEPYGCDGWATAVDSTNPETSYGTSNCDKQTISIVNPVVGTVGGTAHFAITLPTGTASSNQPFATDPTVAHALLTAGLDPSNNPQVLRSTDGLSVAALTLSFPQKSTLTALASAATNNFQTYYVGLTFGNDSAVYTTTNGGANWMTVPVGLPTSLQPNAFAVSATDDHRAFAAFGGAAGGAVSLTTDTGSTWHDISGSGATAIPGAVTAIAADPSDPNTVYAGTNVGVFIGKITTTPALSATWIPFDQGLPDAADVMDLHVNPATRTLAVSVFGHGVYTRDIAPGPGVPAAQLVVRAKVYDTGTTPSPFGVPDPENPVATTPPFYAPDDTPEGSLYWWTSPDIRIDVPSADAPANTIANADGVEMESCPIVVVNCPPNTLVDRSPQRGAPANVYVQVQNNGLAVANKVRVMAMYADASAGVPDLPATFWSTTFPKNSTSCGALDSSTGWHAPDPAHPCALIDVVNPAYPQTAKFVWNVSGSQAAHSCMIVFVDSPDDPITQWRAANEVHPAVIVPGDRHVSQRNLQVIDAPAGGAPFSGEEIVHVSRTTREAPLSLIVSRRGLGNDGALSLFLPPGAPGKTAGFSVVSDSRFFATQKPSATVREAMQRKIDLSREYRLTAVRGGFASLPIAHDAYVLVHYTTGKRAPGTALRFSILQREGKRVVGGASYLVRTPRTGP